ADSQEPGRGRGFCHRLCQKSVFTRGPGILPQCTFQHESRQSCYRADRCPVSRKLMTIPHYPRLDTRSSAEDSAVWVSDLSPQNEKGPATLDPFTATNASSAAVE